MYGRKWKPKDNLIIFQKFHHNYWHNTEMFSNIIAMIMQTCITKSNSLYIKSIGSRDNPVYIEIYTLFDRGMRVRFSAGQRFFSSPQLPDRLWDPLNLKSDGYRGQKGRSLKLLTYLNTVPRLMCEALPHFPHTPSWLGA
jgi:hypothetical protein